MKSFIRFLAAFGVVALLGGGCMPSTIAKPSATTTPAEDKNGNTALFSEIKITSITTKKGKTDSLRNIVIHETTGKEIHSPLLITGEARLWYFEAVFPVMLYDAKGRSLGMGPAQAKGDWMTEDWVPFEAQFAFPDQTAGSHGTILMMNDNPSGIEENSDSFEIPVTF